MRVEISSTENGERGTVDYNETTKELTVTHKDEAFRQKVIDYLTTERPYTIPTSQRLDDCRTDREKTR